jgi:hypothetical protein
VFVLDEKPASWTEDGNRQKSIAIGYKKIKKNVYGLKQINNFK